MESKEKEIELSKMLGMSIYEAEKLLEGYTLTSNMGAFNFSDRTYISGNDKIMLHVDSGIVRKATRK